MTPADLTTLADRARRIMDCAPDDSPRERASWLGRIARHAGVSVAALLDEMHQQDEFAEAISV